MTCQVIRIGVVTMHPIFGFDVESRFGDMKETLETCMKMKIALISKQVSIIL